MEPAIFIFLADKTGSNFHSSSPFSLSLVLLALALLLLLLLTLLLLLSLLESLAAGLPSLLGRR